MRICLIFFLSLLLLICCKTPNRIEKYYYEGKGDTMVVSLQGGISNSQFDSICEADTLPNDLEEWQSYSAKDYETGRKFVIWFYMKDKGASETMYRIEKYDDGDSLKITKRDIK